MKITDQIVTIELTGREYRALHRLLTTSSRNALRKIVDDAAIVEDIFLLAHNFVDPMPVLKESTDS